jgi:voltage-gated potassium channel
VNRLQRYEQRTSPVMTVLAVVFLLLYAAPIVVPALPGPVRVAVRSATGLVWLAFAVDLVVRVTLAEHRARFLAQHPVDVAAVVLPVLRPLRVLRVFTATQALFTRSDAFLRRGQAISTTAALLVLVGALAELDAERGARAANITGFGEALWWSITTVTTVGYGDYYPVTSTGKIVAAGLMLVGISLVGAVTATVAAWFVSQGRAADDDARALQREVRALRDDVARLTSALTAAQGPPPPSGVP